MRVIIVISQLLCGGAETVVYRFLRAASQYGIESRIAVLGEIDWLHFSSLDHSQVMQMTPLKKTRHVLNNYSRIKFIRSSIKAYQPDIVLSFINTTNILTLLATRGLNKKVIISERNNPSRATISKIWFLLRNIFYPMADCLVVANKGLYLACERYNKERIIIANIMSLPSRVHLNAQIKRIIAVGSLTQQKRFDLLIDAVYLLFKKNVLLDYHVDIFGEGPLKSSLENHVHRLGLRGVINFQGKSNNIFDEYVKSDIFVLCSDFEGQPNVLLEAMSSGLACIATDCDFGPRELISHDQDGLLVPIEDLASLADAIEKLIYSESLRESLGYKAREKIFKLFSQDVIMMQWCSLFEKLLQK